LGVSYLTFMVMSAIFPETSPHIHQLSGVIPASLVNYFLNSYWTFR
jgi:dolichol-phosphate mannosyltransferase